MVVSVAEENTCHYCPRSSLIQVWLQGSIRRIVRTGFGVANHVLDPDTDLAVAEMRYTTTAVVVVEEVAAAKNCKSEVVACCY